MLVLCLDFGTSNLKAALFDSEGQSLWSAQESYPTVTGAEGEVTQNPEHWWEAAVNALRSLPPNMEVGALSVTGQMQDLILVANNQERRLSDGNALLYSDTRAKSQFARLSEALVDWDARTGNTQDVTSVPSKALWLQENEPQRLVSAAKVLFGAPGFITWKCTGKAVCDVTTASTTGYLDVQQRCWMPDVVRASGLKAEQMPDLVGSVLGDQVVGQLTEEAARSLNLIPGIPVLHGLGDAGSTTDGITGIHQGRTYIYLGTTGWVAGTTRAKSELSLVGHTLALPGWQDELRIGALQSVGGSALWARNTFFPGLSFDEVEELTYRRVHDLSGRPYALPGLAGERAPVRNPNLQGAFVGISPKTDAVDLYLSMLTGVAMGLKHVATELGLGQNRIPVVGGGAKSKTWVQILADVFATPMLTGIQEEPGVYSALRTAAVQLGFRDVPAPLFESQAELTVTHPSPTQPQYQSALQDHRELYSFLDSIHVR